MHIHQEFFFGFWGMFLVLLYALKKRFWVLSSAKMIDEAMPMTFPYSCSACLAFVGLSPF